MGEPEADNRDEQRAFALRWRRAFPGDDAQIGALRRWLECLLPPCSSRDDLISVAVELGTNAVRHTASGSGGQFVVEVTWWVQMTRVAVYDDGGVNSPRITEGLLCEDGRGLLMVNALSVRMGVGGNAEGRVVWADILWTGQDLPSRPEFLVIDRARSAALPWIGPVLTSSEAALNEARPCACVEPACRT